MPWKSEAVKLSGYRGPAKNREVEDYYNGSPNRHNAKNHDLKLIQFNEHYNIHEYPPTEEEGEPLPVGFQINLRNVLEVNEVSQICTLETTIRLYWQDTRVKMKPKKNKTSTYVTLNPKAADHFWIPDIFIDQVQLMCFPHIAEEHL